MSKAKKAQAKDKRRKEKASKKASKKAQYAAWRDAGVTKGSKRQRAKKKGKTPLRTARKRKHIPFPVHLFLDKHGNLKPGSPHRAWLELQRQ